jgi:superfamily II DNA/RNA helicase
MSWNSVIGIRCLNIWGAHFLVFHDFARLAALLEEVSSVEDNKTLIFVETKKKVENITRSIRRYG